MSKIEEHIDSINAKLQSLLKKYVALKKENSILSNELEILKENEKAFLEKIDSLQLREGIRKASLGELADGEKKDFEKRINQYIKDLDKCISMLNN
jgi:hypothetical protein